MYQPRKPNRFLQCLPGAVAIPGSCHGLAARDKWLARSDAARPLYACIGAMLRILLHFFFLSSCPTTPLTRVPTGSPALLIKTHALSSNRTTLPSLLETFCFVRTTTACRMSPRLTLFAAEEEAMPSAWAPLCFWTTTTIRSPGWKLVSRAATAPGEDQVPIDACLFWPTIIAHSTMAAPELSMQFSIDC